MNEIQFLDCEDIIYIHERLAEDAAQTQDPISPIGIKDRDLLESAVARQLVGIGDTLKYSDAVSCAVTLCYGICNNHPFYNGNKRAALVALMCHLDKNGLTFNDRANQDNLYAFMKNVAAHDIPSLKRVSSNVDLSDSEVNEMINWVSKRTRKLEKSERSISFKELEKRLNEFDVYFENPHNNKVDVIKYETEIRVGVFRNRKVRVSRKINTIPYFPNRPVGKALIKSIRRETGLTANNGIDSAHFYGNELIPDQFIQKYQKTIRALAKT